MLHSYKIVVVFYKRADRGNEYFRRGAYTDVRNPRKTQFDEGMRSLEETTLLIIASFFLNYKR